MATSKILVAKLAEYNKGVTVSQWFEFPLEKSEINEFLGSEPEYIILDSDNCIFSVGEHDSIEKLNNVWDTVYEAVDIAGFVELSEILKDESQRYDVNSYAELAINMFVNIGAEFSVLNDEEVDAMLKRKVASGWEYSSVKVWLSSTDYSSSYHYLDAYGNLQPLTWDVIQRVMSDTIQNIKHYHGL